ncbi:MAG: glycosyltransferase [Parvularculaceae bacterium]
MRLFSRADAAALAAAATIGAASIAVAPQTTGAASAAMAATFFLASVLTRLALLVASVGAEAGDEAPALADDALPTLTILAPVHDEADALPSLARAIGDLDYPPAKLDVKLILEESDAATRREAERLGLDRRFDFVIVPTGGPKTKPKACNYALEAANGDVVVIYDAEDVPAPDQARKAAAAFAAGGEDLVCVQARLNFYNADENWLTRLFALDYALWFDNMLPGLQRIGAPIPLGGTSNFLKTDKLRELGAWDAFNGTEDADLGFRFARAGLRSALIASTTMEEANGALGNWLRQRSRWMKGYMQTWRVHARRGAGFDAGGRFDLRSGLSCHLFLGGAVLGAIVSPWLWIAAAARVVASDEVGGFGLAALLIGNGAIVATYAIAPLRRGWVGLAPWALLAPVYWLLISAAAFKALGELIVRPHHWEKTTHVLGDAALRRRASALQELAAARSAD